VVVDDHSTDGTADVAEASARALFDGRPDGLRADVVAGPERPGKGAAIARGLAERRHEELVLLTDADVLFERDAIVRLSRAFADPRLGMACGEQRFVASLLPDGRADPRAPSAAGLYDRTTALVRRLESASGALFSVHGQCLAWRAALSIAPTPGFAADDLDLMLQVRAARQRVERIGGARFHEEKAAPGPEREARALRRARAYVQFLGHPLLDDLGRGPLSRAQVGCYRRLPTAAPWLAPLVLLGALALAHAAAGPGAAAIAALALGLLAASSPGRRLIALLGVIARATRREARASLGDVWETARR
jgi:glycosyltransferase involved in cell wall biosynthesis